MKSSDLIQKITVEDAKIAKLEQEVKTLKKKRESLELRLLAKLKKMKASQLKVGKILATVRESQFLSIANRPKFIKYVVLRKAYDLFQNRVSPTAVREREEHGEKVPGLKTFTKNWIQLKRGK